MGGAAKTGAGARPSAWRRWLRRVLLGAGGLAMLVAIAHQWVLWSVAGVVYRVDDAPVRSVILVLGASVRPGGRPSPMLVERLRAAAELYHAGKAPKIIVSGDHGRRDYDEVLPMASYLEEQGVPARDIFLDHAGFRTLDSVARARAVFGADQAIIVSNPFHVPRAVFLARSFGLDAVGVAADYGVVYSRGTRLRNEVREIGARVLAFLDVFVLGTQPGFLGPPIELGGDGRLTRVSR